MKWEKLGPKEPEFNEACLFIDEKDNWWEGELEEIKHTSNGKVYTVSYGSEGGAVTNATHFMRITPPKE